MDRRSFLQLLGAVGVLTGAPKWLLGPQDIAKALAPGLDLTGYEDDDVSEWLDPYDLAVQSRPTGRTVEASWYNTSTQLPAQVQLRRLPEDGGGIIMQWLLSPQSTLTWRAYRGEEIYGPIKIVSPSDVMASVVGTNSEGRLVMASKNGIIPFNPN